MTGVDEGRGVSIFVSSKIDGEAVGFFFWVTDSGVGCEDEVRLAVSFSFRGDLGLGCAFILKDLLFCSSDFSFGRAPGPGGIFVFLPCSSPVPVGVLPVLFDVDGVATVSEVKTEEVSDLESLKGVPEVDAVDMDAFLSK